MGLIRWSHVEPDVTTEMILDIEKKYDVVFPTDYKECILSFNGGYPKPNIFDYDDGAQGLFSDLISFTNLELNMSMIYEYSKEELPERIVPFGRDPFGNFLCFDYRYVEKGPTIVFYDHESEFEDERFIYICDTFTQLLSELYSL